MGHAQAGAHGADSVAGGEDQRRARIEANWQGIAAHDQRMGIKPTAAQQARRYGCDATTLCADVLCVPLLASTLSLHTKVACSRRAYCKYSAL